MYNKFKFIAAFSFSSYFNAFVYHTCLFLSLIYTLLLFVHCFLFPWCLWVIVNVFFVSFIILHHVQCFLLIGFLNFMFRLFLWKVYMLSGERSLKNYHYYHYCYCCVLKNKPPTGYCVQCLMCAAGYLLKPSGLLYMYGVSIPSTFSIFVIF